MAYLDHAATTPMLPEAVEALSAHLGATGNASSLHASGRKARRTVEESRETLAEALGARPSEIVFTSGGTEADNLAVKGLYWSRRDADPARTRVLASPVEQKIRLRPPAKTRCGIRGGLVVFGDRRPRFLAQRARTGVRVG